MLLNSGDDCSSSSIWRLLWASGGGGGGGGFCVFSGNKRRQREQERESCTRATLTFSQWLYRTALYSSTSSAEHSAQHTKRALKQLAIGYCALLERWLTRSPSPSFFSARRFAHKPIEHRHLFACVKIGNNYTSARAPSHCVFARPTASSVTGRPARC